MKLSRKVRQEIASRPIGKLAAYHDEKGRRLHVEGIRGEIVRRVKQASAEHPVIKKHREKRRSRTLK
jgi:hypothetical protein